MTNKIIRKRQVYSGNVTNVSEVDLEFDTGQKRTFELIDFNVLTGVSALPIHQDKIILIKHYQAGIDKIGYSLPTGGLEAGEDPQTRMQLELQEEIGFKAGKLTLMTRLHTLPGYIGSDAGYLYLAQDLTASTLKGDEPYAIEIIQLELKTALSLVQSGEIQDARSVLAILYYQQFFAGL